MSGENMFRFKSLFYSLSVCFGIIFILSTSSTFAFAEEKPEIFVQLGHIMGVQSEAFSPDGRFALSGSGDTTTRIWDVNTGKEIAQFISFTDGEWVVITPEGYFNASSGGAKHLNFC